MYKTLNICTFISCVKCQMIYVLLYVMMNLQSYIIICSALEGGINYWCDNIKVIGNYIGDYGHEQISRGGRLLLYDLEGEQELLLTKKKFLDGLMKYLKKTKYSDILKYIEYEFHLDFKYVDAEVFIVGEIRAVFP